MPGINPSVSVQVALVEIRSAGSVGRRARRRTPAAAWVCGINPSVSVQGTPIVIRAALLGISRASVPRHGDQRHRQRGQDPEDSAAHDCLPFVPGFPDEPRTDKDLVAVAARQIPAALRTPRRSTYIGLLPALFARQWQTRPAHRGDDPARQVHPDQPYYRRGPPRKQFCQITVTPYLTP